MEQEKYYDTIRSMIHHETTLRNNRLTWMLALQGFLFAAYGVLWCKSLLAIIVVGLTGLCTSLSICFGLNICSKAIDTLNKLGPQENDIQRGKWPPVIGHCQKKYRFFLPWKVLPLWFAGVWILLLLIAIF